LIIAARARHRPGPAKQWLAVGPEGRIAGVN
jgi:hypothetical protein